MRPFDHAGENAGPAGRANRSCHECIFETDTLGCQSVHVRGFENRVHDTEHVESLIVRDDEEQIGSIDCGEAIVFGFFFCFPGIADRPIETLQLPGLVIGRATRKRSSLLEGRNIRRKILDRDSKTLDSFARTLLTDSG